MTYVAKPKLHHPTLPKNTLGFTRRDYEGKVSTLCAGCGHDSISAALIQAFFELDVQPHRVAKLSGIGCSSKTPKEALAWASAFDKPVLYVPGNHEFYGGSIAGTVDELKRLSAGSNIRVLDDDEVVIEGVRFLGSTLWTDFLLFGEGEKRAAAMREAQGFIRDFSRIRAGDAPFTPEASARLFARHEVDRLLRPAALLAGEAHRAGHLPDRPEAQCRPGAPRHPHGRLALPSSDEIF